MLWQILKLLNTVFARTARLPRLFQLSATHRSHQKSVTAALLYPLSGCLSLPVTAFCHARESLQSLCSLITGDALLYSMFRVEATPVECPFKGPLSFTYNRGHGECRSPVSSIDSCTEESRLLLRYQACPDVHGTESTGKETISVTF